MVEMEEYDGPDIWERPPEYKTFHELEEELNKMHPVRRMQQWQRALSNRKARIEAAKTPDTPW